MTEAATFVHSSRENTLRLTVGLCVSYFALVLLFYASTTGSIVSIWERSDTYAHGFLILPIALWLVWDKRKQLADTNASPLYWVTAMLIPVGLLWLVASLVEVLVVQQLALVAMLVIGIWALLGHRLAGAIAFPLGFLFLAVPMGEDLVPPLMEFTADSTVWLIQLTGIPVYREGLFFSLPTGNWSVVEACSGVRYLIASFTLGLLFAHLTYRSLGRKILFVLASVLIPILANTARAYIIVMLGHLSGMKLATGVDHLVYGWVFFGFVMLLLFWVGSFWREDDTEAQRQTPVRAADPVDAKPEPLARHLGVFLVAVVLAGVWPAYALLASQGPGAISSAQLEAPPGDEQWASAEEAPWSWRPARRGAARELTAYYSNRSDRVALYIDQFLRRPDGPELISGKKNEFIDRRQGWRVAKQRQRAIALPGGEFDIIETRLSGLCFGERPAGLELVQRRRPSDHQSVFCQVLRGC